MFSSNLFDMLLQVHPFVLSVVECLKAMSFTLHATLELRELNYETFWIENAPSIPSTFGGDVFFELPLVDNPNGHLG
jgi:hypothetical protein